ncbi:hypothetical protein [Pedobacter heparinus]|uniref:Uncharacterized protein n=1 Tax=Pedobacter heparinus (strain ATCC 13125 / DSM 2366 / CIP 104194 / JCM 7457 / NBRC 12017 / NCIMB 9290 / NRRL B-14731 / HIM 762-3) TaxID=485917 RepID=C6XV87_PEDHD|nr:hypothetical protein [Pedobacter heparinus]ACU03953.1 hypothetical protein Phep_1743 [Pedobacter heparinus DSM 2366]
MKNLELNNLGVQEMNELEMSKIEGGGLLGSLLGGILPTVNTVVSDTLQYVGKQVNNVLSLLGSL